MTTLEALIDAAALETLRRTNPTMVETIEKALALGATPKTLIAVVRRLHLSPLLLGLIDCAVNELARLNKDKPE